jgi:hypothetical protein
MLGQRRFGKIQTVLLAVIALVIGASLISPAVGHVKKSLKHLYKHLDPRYVNVGETVAQATNATNATNAANAGTLDNIDSTGFLQSGQIQVSHNGQLSINAFGVSDGVVQDAVNETQISATGAGLAWVQLHMAGPVRLGKKTFGLQNVRICYDVTAGDPITDTTIYDHSTGLTVQAFNDPTDRTATASTCYTITPPSPIAPAGSLVLVLKWDPSTAGDALGIQGITSTWVPTGDAPARAASGGEEGGLGATE